MSDKLKYEYNKFKVGDKVRYKTQEDSRYGNIYTFIEEDGTEYPWFLDSKGHERALHNHNLELVTSEPTYNIF
ncbi:hypothetical protein ACI3PL_19975 [Lacticaseibacillus paracasei]